MYLALHDDEVTVACCFDCQLIGALPMKKRYPPVNCQVFLLPAQLESVYPMRFGLFVSAQYVILSLSVPLRYQNTCLMAFQWVLREFDEY